MIMKKFRITIAIVLSSSLLLFTACEKDNNEPDALESFTVQIDATSYSDWVFFSFDDGAEVTVSDPQNDTSWDIGLKRNHFKTNSGTSGSGSGGAYDGGVVDFDIFSIAPTDGYTVDTSIDVFDFGTMEYAPEPGNTLLETWGEFTEDMPPTLVPSNKVFVIKTADGKYAKMIVQNYYGNDGSGFVTFTYAYQADGSTRLK